MKGLSTAKVFKSKVQQNNLYKKIPTTSEGKNCSIEAGELKSSLTSFSLEYYHGDNSLAAITVFKVEFKVIAFKNIWE